MLFSVEQAFVGREEIRAPLKTPAWEASIKTTGDKISKHLEVIIISNTSKSVSSDIQTLRSNTSNTRKSDLSGMRTTT